MVIMHKDNDEAAQRLLPAAIILSKALRSLPALVLSLIYIYLQQADKGSHHLARHEMEFFSMHGRQQPEQKRTWVVKLSPDVDLDIHTSAAQVAAC